MSARQIQLGDTNVGKKTEPLPALPPSVERDIPPDYVPVFQSQSPVCLIGYCSSRAVLEVRDIVDKDERKTAAETPGPSLQVKTQQRMTTLTTGNLRDELIDQPLPFYPPMRKEQLGVNPLRPQLCAPAPVSSSPTMEATVVRASKKSIEIGEAIPGSRSGHPCASEPAPPTLTMEPTAPRTSKRRLGMRSTTGGYPNKKFKVPAKA